MPEVVRLQSTSPLSWDVEEALEYALKQIRSGSYKADKVYIALCDSPRDGSPHSNTRYVLAGMNNIEALGWLQLHENHLMSETD